jgi:phosphoglycerol geranylgeranyltransferase
MNRHETCGFHMVRVALPDSSTARPTATSEKIVSTSVYQRLLTISDERGAGFVVLIDPDKLAAADMARFADFCLGAGVDALFVGGSLCHATELDTYVAGLRRVTDLPVIGFPGSITQISRHLDAILYLSIVSGRNPEYLFGQHVHAAPIIHQLGIEAIPTGYMLIESGRPTTAQYMSHSLPIPRHKADVAAATGLAAEMMGMKLLFTDGGSGADDAVPVEMISAIVELCSIPLVVGGGIRTPRQVAERVDAGARFIVVGNAFEERPDASYMAEMAAAAHSLVPRAV